MDAVHREIKEYLPGLKTTNYDQKEDIESGQIRTTSLNHNPSAISICIDNLRVRYPPKQRMMASKGANDRGMVAGVNGVSLAINRGEIFGLVCEIKKNLIIFYYYLFLFFIVLFIFILVG